MVYHISYDLRKPGNDYESLYAAIRKLGNWCHPVESTWYVNSVYNPTEIHDMLKRVMDSSDSLIITTAKAPGAWSGLTPEVTKWFKVNL